MQPGRFYLIDYGADWFGLCSIRSSHSLPFCPEKLVMKITNSEWKIEARAGSVVWYFCTAGRANSITAFPYGQLSGFADS
jgi:hypothetical protein